MVVIHSHMPPARLRTARLSFGQLGGRRLDRVELCHAISLATEAIWAYRVRRCRRQWIALGTRSASLGSL